MTITPVEWSRAPVTAAGARGRVGRGLLPFALVDDFYLPQDDGDWLPAFQRAQASTSWVLLTPGMTYPLTQALRNVSNRRWTGGPGTKVVVARSGNSATVRCAFMLGNIHPAMFSYEAPGTDGHLPAHGISAVAPGAVSVTLTTGADSANYEVGQFVAVRSVAERTASGVQYPSWVHFTKVTGVAGAVVTLADPIHETVSPACMSPIGTTTDPHMGYQWEFVENVILEDIEVDADSIVSTRTGAYRCTLERLSASGGAQHLLAVNAFIHSRVTDIVGDLADRLLEVKCYSRDSVFTGIRGSVTGASTFSPIDIAEQSHGCTMANIRATVPPSSGMTAPAVTISGVRNVLRDSDIAHMGAWAGGSTVLNMPSSGFDGYPDRGNVVLDTRLTAGAARASHVDIGSTGEAAVIGACLDRVEMIGTVTTGHSVRSQSATGASVARCRRTGDTSTAVGSSAPTEWANSTV